MPEWRPGAEPPTMTQKAAFPLPLAALVEKLKYKPSWSFALEDIDRGQGSEGLTLTIHIVTPDAYHPEVRRGVIHYFIVPAAAYDERSWQRWLFDQVLQVETHEAMEFFQVDGARPYAPSHGPGSDPYMVREVGTTEDVRTSFRGELHEG